LPLNPVFDGHSGSEEFMTATAAQPEGLISVLLDRTAPVGDRHDAAMDLGTFDEAAVLVALIEVASDAQEDELILDGCGESIAEIWARQRMFDSPTVAGLTEPARAILLGTLRALAPNVSPLVERG
jgi:hypothetical protein